MKLIKFALPSILLLAGPLLRAEPAPVSTPPPADPMAEALAILEAKDPDFGALKYHPGDTLSDLISRSNGTISLASGDSATPVPILTAVLPDGVLYWRMASFTPKKDWGDLAGDMRWMMDYWHVYGAILDLRSNSTVKDYAGAAQVLAFFAPGDASLWEYLPQKNEGTAHLPLEISDPTFAGPLVVLTNGQTSGAAESLAGRLQADGAIVVGRATAGPLPVYDEHTLMGGQILRIAEAGTSQDPADPKLPVRPVVPDIALTVDEHNEKAALAQIRDSHVLDVIQESAERHRLSEASLVQGQDPEWDAYLATLENGPVLLSLPRIHDPVLISGLDSLRAIRLSQRTGPPPVQAAANSAVKPATSIQ